MPDHDLVQLFAQYSGMAPEEIVEAAGNYAAFNQVHWQECGGATWEERVREFYGLADGYVFDLIHSNRSKSHLRGIYERFGHWRWFEQSGPEVLELSLIHI